MDAQQNHTRLEIPCSEDDMDFLRQKYAQQNKLFRIFCYLIIFIALVFPFVPSKYKPHNALVDIMSYHVAVLAVIGAFLAAMVSNYYFLIYRLKKDITEGKKIVLTATLLKRGKVSTGGMYIIILLWRVCLIHWQGTW